MQAPVPPRPPSPANLSHQLCIESALASLESALRRGIQPDSLATFHPLEKLADLYLERPTGHRLDNIDRALASYSLASRTAASALQPSADLDSARLSAKLAHSWYLRLQYVSHHCVDVPLVKRAHLSAAADAIDIALQRYDDCGDWQHDVHQRLLYNHALLCKGFIYHAMCANVHLQISCDAHADPRDLEHKQSLWRRVYVNSCIQSLEKALLSDASKLPPKSSQHHSALNQTDQNPSSPNHSQPTSNHFVQIFPVQHDVQNVTKARAIICLARAYVDTSNIVAEKVSKTLKLLDGVEKLLDKVDVNKHHDGFIVMEDDVQRMREDAKCLQQSLKQNCSTPSQGGCVIS
ncbi:unnamed protein product [Agarophyton chilense]